MQNIRRKTKKLRQELKELVQCKIYAGKQKKPRQEREELVQ